MAKSLVIVESPAKARTINKFLGRGFSVKASMGHVRDLPKRKLGVDEKKDFKPTYEVLPGRKKILDELKKAAGNADAIYLAPDPDREGEAICWHLSEELKKVNKNLFRVLFNEITKRAVVHGIENPQKLDSDKVNAQQARRILDRLMGYKISPLLWEKVRRGLSAGRVQSVALRIVVERERAIQAFKPEEYWSVTATLEGGKETGKSLPFLAKLAKIGKKKADLKNEKSTQGVLGKLKSAEWRVEKVEAKEKKKNPPPPFTTSKLQQEAARKLGYTVRKSMMVAQRLYEGIEIGDAGPVGLITYMRTDSTRVAPEALDEVRTHIGSAHGKEYLPAKPRLYKSGRMSQGAHEAIRPTSMENTPEKVQKHLSRDEFRLYSLIWNRFVASQINPARFDVTTVDINANDHIFRANGTVLRFDGYLAVYQETTDSKNGDPEESKMLPPLEQGQVLKLLKIDPKQHFTQPPPRFSEATLVKELEENGIGRPSTYATILTILQNREYAVKTEGRFVPSELGILVTELLVKHFGDLVNVEYTARMEEELDEIEVGKLAWKEAIREFHQKFSKDLKLATTQMRNIKTEETPTEEVCSKCGKPMVIKWGRYGRFLGCSGYPDCKNTQELGGAAGKDGGGETAETPEINVTCEKCGSAMVLRKGRFGQFLACSTYPACRNTKKVQFDKEGKITKKADRVLDETCPKCKKHLVVKDGRFGEFTACSDYPTCRYIKLKEVGVGCPKEGCDGQVVERKSRRGRTFYGCNRYPDCDFVTWYKPLDQKCPDCGRAYILEKTTKRDGVTHFCDAEGCGYKKSVKS